MIVACGLLLAGYSIFGCLLIAITHFRAGSYPDHIHVRYMGMGLLLTLMLLQLAHASLLLGYSYWLASPLYRATLFAAAPCFYLYSHPLLHPTLNSSMVRHRWPHALPMLVGAFLPFPIAFPLAFALGMAYLLWFARSIYLLRSVRERFQRELVLVGSVVLIAAIVAILALLPNRIHTVTFFALYSTAIGIALWLAQLTLGLRPAMQEDVVAAVGEAYRSSTLGNVDCDMVQARLEQLMREDRLYQDAELSLSVLAKHLGLGAHQLSELLNARLAKGFSRYLREQRVAAACAMLLAEPAASVLSVGLSVGFASQSNFYEAFREIEGMTPGNYRKLMSVKK
jgi:AraC-like DNA-binding protein